MAIDGLLPKDAIKLMSFVFQDPALPDRVVKVQPIHQACERAVDHETAIERTASCHAPQPSKKFPARPQDNCRCGRVVE
jgi:hypothetical protein